MLETQISWIQLDVSIAMPRLAGWCEGAIENVGRSDLISLSCAAIGSSEPESLCSRTAPGEGESGNR